MADEAREYLRAAQQAEMRGDKPQAVDLLVKAATLYRQRGSTARALQMLRHASRLDATRTDIADEVRRLEWMPDRPMLRAVTDEEEDEEDRRVLAPLDELAAALAEASGDPQPVGAAEKQLIERGPTRADPALNAWCSFCCKPRAEVGDLIAGPAGAFVCAACVKEAGRLLGVGQADQAGPSTALKPIGNEPDPGGAPVQGERSAAESNPPPATSTVSVAAAPAQAAATARPAAALDAVDAVQVGAVGQEDARRTLQTALKLNVACVLLVGPEGSGKSEHLRELARQGHGVYVATPRGMADAPEDAPMLIDQIDQATPDELQQLLRLLETRASPVVLAARGLLRPAALRITREDEELPVHTRAALAEATGGKLPLALLDRVQTAAGFTPPTREELVEIARRLAVGRASDLDVSDELFGALADLALESGRSGHELKALLARLPSGGWSAKRAPEPPLVAPSAAEAPKKQRAARKKKAEE